MKYIISWLFPQSTYNSTVARFLETGCLPPEDVKLIGRWHGMSGQGFGIAETDNAKALFLWQAQWADLVPLTVTPCLDDAEAGEVLTSLAKR